MLVVVPLFISETVVSANLRVMTLPLIIFIVVILFVIGIFFLINYRLLSLLEREDWPALAYYLEQKIYGKNRYSNRNVRLLASSYMVISDYFSVLKLESKAALARPSVIDKNILIFGSARILSGKYTEASAFFRNSIEKGNLNPKDEEWVKWFCGFSNLLNGSFSQVEPEFTSMAATSPDAVITGISAFFLFNNIAKHSHDHAACMDAADVGRTRVKKALKTAGEWKKEVDRIGTEIHVAIIRKYVDEARDWIYSGQEHSESVKEIDSELHSHDHTHDMHPTYTEPPSSHHVISDKQYDQEHSNLKESGHHEDEDKL
jgi:hypothetical protein